MAAVVLLLSCGRAVSANPVDAYGFGARAAGMAGAHTAAADDSSANYYNAAAMARFERIHLDFGYQYSDPSLNINGLDSQVDSSQGSTLGLVVPGAIGSVPVAVGVALYLPDARLARTRTLARDQPRFVLFDNRPQRMLAVVNVAASLGERVHLGAGIGYMSGTTGEVVMSGRLGFPNHLDSDLALALDVDLEEVRYPLAGVLVEATDWLDLGLAYRGGFELEVVLNFQLAGDVGTEGAEPVVEDGFFSLDSTYRDLFQPEQFAAGACARLGDSVMLALDVVYHRWSEFGHPAANIVLGYELGAFNDQVDVPAPVPLPKPEFHDIIAPHLGIEWQPLHSPDRELVMRAGYGFEPTPTPLQSGETNFIDGDKHTVSLGAGLTLAQVTELLPQPFSIDAYGAVTWMRERVHQKLSPVDSVGDYRAGGTILQLGITSRWRF